MGSVDDYPEHLNPFRERRGSIRSSFRGFMNTLRRKKHDRSSVNKIGSPPTIRKHTTAPDNTTYHRRTAPVYTQYEYQPVPLPRYRASEVLPKKEEPKQYNPFEEDEDTTQAIPVVVETPATPLPNQEPSQALPETKEDSSLNLSSTDKVVRKSHRRKKRRAPLPPGTQRMEGSNLLNVSSNQSDSQWSLTSEYSEYSSYASEYGDDVAPSHIPIEASEELLNLTREINKLNDDTNNNIIVNQGDIETKDDVKETDNVKEIDDKQNKPASNDNTETCGSLEEKIENVEQKETAEDVKEEKDKVVEKIENNVNQAECNGSNIDLNNKDEDNDLVATQNNVILNKPDDVEKKSIMAKVSSIEELDEFDKDLGDDEVLNTSSFKESLESIKKSLEKIDVDIDTEKEVSEEKEIVTSTPLGSPTKSNCNLEVEKVYSNGESNEKIVKEMNDINTVVVTDNKLLYISANEDNNDVEEHFTRSDVNRQSIKNRIKYFEEAHSESKSLNSSDEEPPIPKTRTKKLTKATLLGSQQQL